MRFQLPGDGSSMTIGDMANRSHPAPADAPSPTSDPDPRDASIRPRLRVAVVGAGVLGRAVARGVARRADLELVAVVDADPQLAGTSLDLGGAGGEPVVVSPALLTDDVDVVAVLTASRLDQVGDLLITLAERGVNVVTAAEELTYPWRSHPRWSARLDAAARARGVSILGVGANPGLLMDTLVTVLSLASQRVERIVATRTMDVRVHRAARLQRFGIGLTPAEFAAQPSDTLHGHIGFRQSIDALADALGWPVDEVVESPLSVAHVTTTERTGDLVTLPVGTVAVVEQHAKAVVGGETRIELREHFGFVDPGDPVPTGDAWTITGADQTVSLASPGGVHSFSTTPATVVNMIGPVHAAPAGLRTVGDFPVRALASKGGA